MATPGYIWVEGNYLCYIDSSGIKRGGQLVIFGFKVITYITLILRVM